MRRTAWLPAAWVATASGLGCAVDLPVGSVGDADGDDAGGRHDAGDDGFPATPPGRVATGGATSCAIADDGGLGCWGVADLPPGGVFREVSLGALDFGCALDDLGAIRCWGSSVPGPIPDGRFVRIAAGRTHACALDATGEVTCWADLDPPTAPPGPFVELTSSNRMSCARRSEGTVACWGDPGDPRAAPPDLAFRQISLGPAAGCGIAADRRLRCWGDDGGGLTAPPTGSFTHVEVGLGRACARGTDGGVVCWGGLARDDSPDVPVTELSYRSSHGCAVTAADGLITCWGLDDRGQASPP